MRNEIVSISFPYNSNVAFDYDAYVFFNNLLQIRIPREISVGKQYTIVESNARRKKKVLQETRLILDENIRVKGLSM